MIRKHSMPRPISRGALLLVAVLAVLTALSTSAQVRSSHQVSPGDGRVPLPSAKSSRAGKPRSRPESGTLQFLPPVGYFAGGTTTGAVVADVNGDGKLDILAVSGNPDVMGVLLGNGDGTFQPVQTYSTTGYNPWSLAVADLNGDGRLDIVTVNSCVSSDNCTSSSVDVFLGNGDGTFQPAVAYNSGSGSTKIVIRDINGDGKPDLILANGSNLAVMMGNGDGSFLAPIVDGSIPNGTTNSLAVLDLNGDGKLDVVMSAYTATESCGVPAVFLGNGDGTFQPPAILDSVGYCPLTEAVADLNGDGKPDLVVGYYCVNNQDCSQGSVGVLLGNGDGTFQPTVDYSANPDGFAMAITDLDGDGKLDVVLASTGGYGKSIFLGNGDGTLQPALIDYQPLGADSVVAADLNGDGKPDLVMTGGDVEVLINSTGISSTTTSMTSSVNPVLTGRAITYTVTVTSQDGSQVTGYINMYDSARGFTCSGFPVNNQLICTYFYRTKQAGTHVLTATYTGDSTHFGSSSSPLTEYVQFHSTTRVATSGSPSHAGQAVTFTATVTSSKGKIPNGESVSFYDKKTLLGSAPLSNNQASITTSSLSAKKHTIQAIYSGDNQFGLSHGSVVQVVQP
jgi:hypothetical protein